MKTDDIENTWLKHAYDGFPRKVGTPTQRLIQNSEDYLQYIWSMLGRTDIYTSLFSEPTKEIGQYYRFYIDIDNVDDLEKARQNTVSVCAWFIENSGYGPTVYFSGRKGFAIYFYFKPRKMKEYQYTAHAIVRHIKNIKGIDTIDMTTVGDTSRISRVPFTKHITSGMWCTPVDPLQPIKEIIKNAHKWRNGTIDFEIDIAEGINDFMEEWEEKGKEMKEEVETHLGDGKTYDWDLNLIMQYAPNLIGGRRCLMYRVIIPYMFQNGFSYYETLNYCKRFISASGNNINGLERIFQNHWKQTQRGKSILWSQESFFKHEPWAIGVFTHGERNSKTNIKNS